MADEPTFAHSAILKARWSKFDAGVSLVMLIVCACSVSTYSCCFFGAEHVCWLALPLSDVEIEAVTNSLTDGCVVIVTSSHIHQIIARLRVD